MSDEELLLFNDIYNQTQHFGRTQFVREIMKLQQENKQLKEHIEKYEHYCKTTGIEELMKENKKYKEVIEKAIKYLEAKRIREKAIIDIDVLEGILKEED